MVLCMKTDWMQMNGSMYKKQTEYKLDLINYKTATAYYDVSLYKKQSIVCV